MRKMESEIRYVAATGALGVGVHVESLEKSLEIEPAFIAADAGTTDAGPFSLGMGVPAFAREAVKRDLGALLSVTRMAKIPALIGSAGTAGGDLHVDWVLDIAREIVREQGIKLRTAVHPFRAKQGLSFAALSRRTDSRAGSGAAIKRTNSRAQCAHRRHDGYRAASRSAADRRGICPRGP